MPIQKSKNNFKYTSSSMKITLRALLPCYLVFSGSLYVLAGNALNGSSGTPTEFELKLDSRSDDANSGYLKRSLDGVEAHLVYVKTGSVPTKATEGGKELWQSTAKQTCLAGIVNYKGDEKNLALLVLLNNVSLNGSNPLASKTFKYENGNWTEKSEDEFYKELLSLKREGQDLNNVDLDVSDATKFAELSNVTKTKLGVTLAFHLPEGNNAVGKLTDSGTAIWERDASKNEYGLYLLYGKKNDNEKFLVLLTREGQTFSQKFFVHKTKWEEAEFAEVKNLIKSAFMSSRGNGKKSNGKKN